MNIENFTSNLEYSNGILFSKNKTVLAYPEEGNAGCMQIEENSFWFSHRNNCIVSLVKKFCTNEVFFDIGGGNGFVSKALEGAGIETILVEPGMQGAVNAKNRGLKNIICSSFEDSGFKNNAIGAAGLFDVLEHIKDDYGFLKKLSMYVKTEGLIFISVPAFNFLWSEEDNFAKHFRRYTLKTLNHLLEKSGYEVLYSTYLFFVLPLPVFLFRSLPSRIGVHKNSNDLDKYKKEHSNNSVTETMLNPVWMWELNKINKLKKIPFGSSCLAVAKKK